MQMSQLCLDVTSPCPQGVLAGSQAVSLQSQPGEGSPGCLLSVYSMNQHTLFSVLTLDFLSSVGDAAWLLTHQLLPLGFAAEGAGRILQQFEELLEHSFFSFNIILFFFFFFSPVFFSLPSSSS